MRFFIFIFFISFFFCCKKQTGVDSSVSLITSLLSNDSLQFDTVFVENTTPTKIFKIFNYNKTDILIDKIQLAGGTKSFYKININGVQTDLFQNIRLNAGDSMYIFTNLTVPASQLLNPFEVTDSLGIYFNKKKKNIILHATAQNVIYINQSIFNTDTDWNNKLPIVVKGMVTIAEGKTLKIKEGTKVYFHKNAGLIINGRLKVEGSYVDGKRVLFGNDRWDDDYKMLPGSWNGITFGAASTGNELNNLDIKNAKTAILDTLKRQIPQEKFLKLYGCKIENCSNGIKLKNSSVEMINSLIANCGKGFIVYGGGEYLIQFSTLAGYGNRYIAHDDAVLQLAYTDEQTAEKLNFSFINSILYGQLTDEINLQLTGNNYLITIENSIYKSAGLYGIQYKNSIANADPKFMNIDEKNMLFNFAVGNDSPAKELAKQPAVAIDMDISGNMRGKPRATSGCYE